MLPSAKYREIGEEEWKFKDDKRQSDKLIAELKKVVESHGLKCTIGGLW